VNNKNRYGGFWKPSRPVPQSVWVLISLKYPFLGTFVGGLFESLKNDFLSVSLE